ncbi:hypothetical protein [Sphingomonas bacterium]|uniref:hypothetical protein n=1 Tax=Sphingomonas bacterium TaxID=1895847 RepID=UPI001576D05F|nr:hypothetical protein [Sphingomonas bacterium]
MSEVPVDADDTVTIRSADMMVMIAYLANATVQQSNAIGALAAGDTQATHKALTKAGEQMDGFIALLGQKMGEDVSVEQR